MKTHLSAEWQAEYDKHLEFAEAVRRATIEECAKIVDRFLDSASDNWAAAAMIIADDIRALKSPRLNE